MNKLVIIDGNAIMHRAFHAIPSLSTPKGEPINAVYGLVSMLLNVIQNLKPTHIAVCFDQKEPTFRKKEFKNYQANRPEMVSELSSQFEKAYLFLKSAKIPVYFKSGYEADDVIGTIANNVKNEEVVVVTGDRDMLQLVNDKVKLFMPIGGLASGKIFGDEETKERMGVYPKLIPDLKGLIGDPSDNYKGVAGVGPKTAIKLLEEFGSFQGVYKNLDEIPDKLREKLVKGKKDADISYYLATIIRDVPVEFNIEDMGKWRLDSPEVLNLFENTFGFKTLTNRIKKVGKEIEDSKQVSLF